MDLICPTSIIPEHLGGLSNIVILRSQERLQSIPQQRDPYLPTVHSLHSSKQLCLLLNQLCKPNKHLPSLGRQNIRPIPIKRRPRSTHRHINVLIAGLLHSTNSFTRSRINCIERLPTLRLDKLIVDEQARGLGILLAAGEREFDGGHDGAFGSDVGEGEARTKSTENCGHFGWVRRCLLRGRLLEVIGADRRAAVVIGPVPNREYRSET